MLKNRKIDNIIERKAKAVSEKEKRGFYYGNDTFTRIPLNYS